MNPLLKYKDLSFEAKEVAEANLISDNFCMDDIIKEAIRRGDICIFNSNGEIEVQMLNCNNLTSSFYELYETCNTMDELLKFFGCEATMSFGAKINLEKLMPYYFTYPSINNIKSIEVDKNISGVQLKDYIQRRYDLFEEIYKEDLNNEEKEETLNSVAIAKDIALNYDITLEKLLYIIIYSYLRDVSNTYEYIMNECFGRK